MKLVIVESAGKVDKIQSYLGQGWEVTACLGHVRDLPVNDMGFAPPDFRPQYVATERGENIIAKLKRITAKAEAVYLATDPDREGESIAWHLKEALGLANPLRITFSEINATAVKRAVVQPRGIDGKLVAAQELRRILDRDVGYTVSPVLSKKAGEKLSAGRVQTVAVLLVVEREREIRAFKSTEHYGVELRFGEWTAAWNSKPFLPKDAEYWLDKPFAERVAGVRQVGVSAFEDGERRRSPPPPFITSTLQQAASVKLGFDPDYTMQLAQSLYESGLGQEGAITYMRTDSPHLSDDALADLFMAAQKRGLAMADEPRQFAAKDSAQEAHECIRPTHFDIEDAGKTEDEKALYRLIWQRALACQLEDALYAVRKAVLFGEVDGQAVQFEATGRTLKRAGWLAVQDGDATEENEEAEASNPIPALNVGQTITANDGRVLVKKTKAPARYTQASLIKKLEAEGVGRPSTYAKIMQNIQGRGYIDIKGRQLYAAPAGERVIDALAGHFSFVELDFTRRMEATLDHVAAGKAGYRPTIAEFHALLSAEAEHFEQRVTVTPAHPCPDCGKALRRIEGKDGPFWGCAGHPECSTTLPDANGSPGKRHTCPDCGKPLRRIKGKEGFFWGCTGYPQCATTLPDANGKPGPKKTAPKASAYACKACNKPLVHRVAPATPGKQAYNFWGCSGFPGCKQRYDNVGGKPKFN